MSISPITSPRAAQTGIAPQTQDALSDMNGAAFMQLLLTQMKNQNPLEPMQDREFMSQVTQLNSLKQLEQMNLSLKTLLTQAEPKPDLAQAATLIGKKVEAKDAKGQAVSGLVTAVRLQNDVITLTVNGTSVALSSVSSVSAAPASAPATVAAPEEIRAGKV